MFHRRNLPRVDPLRDPEVIPVASVWALRALLGKWQGIDPESAIAAYMNLGDYAYTGVLECTNDQSGLIVEARRTSSWARGSTVKGSEVRSRLFATAQRFYVDHADDERHYQLVGLRSDSSNVCVRHYRGWGGEQEEWQFIAPDALQISVYRSWGSGRIGDIQLFTRVKD
jgi:hypothetical protein